MGLPYLQVMTSTLVELSWLRKSFEWKQEQEWLRTRNIELAIYQTTIVEGKPAYPSIKKGSHLYLLPSDTVAEAALVKEIKDTQISKDDYLALIEKRSKIVTK